MNNQENNQLVDEARLLLPWSLTGQLSKQEQAMVDAALENSAEFRAEYAQEERMLRTVRENTSLLELSAMDTTELRLNKLLTRIEKEPAHAQAKPSEVLPAITIQGETAWTKFKQGWKDFWQGSGNATWLTPANAVLGVLVLSQAVLGAVYLTKPAKTETLYTVASVPSEQIAANKKPCF